MGVSFFGSYFCYDFPASYENHIKKLFGITSGMYDLLYTFYAIPNFIMPCIGGILIDKFGHRRCVMFFAFLLITG